MAWPAEIVATERLYSLRRKYKNSEAKPTYRTLRTRTSTQLLDIGNIQEAKPTYHRLRTRAPIQHLNIWKIQESPQVHTSNHNIESGN